MDANRPDNFDDMFYDASKRHQYKPSQRVWKGISTHFEKLERKRKLWHGGIIITFSSLCLLSAIYFINKPVEENNITATNLPQAQGREVFASTPPLSCKTAIKPAVFLSSGDINHQPRFELFDSENLPTQSQNNVEFISPSKQVPVTNNSNLGLSNIVLKESYTSAKRPRRGSGKHEFQYGITIGYSNHNPINSNTQSFNSDIVLMPINTLQFGGNIRYTLSSKFELSSGINIYKTGAAYYYNTSAIYATRQELTSNAAIYRNSFVVAEIPLTINYTKTYKNSWGYSIGLGVAAQCKLPSHTNDGGFHIMNYGRATNGLAMVNLKLTKETKKLNFSVGPTLKKQMLTTNRNGNYKLVQTGLELSIGFKF